MEPSHEPEAVSSAAAPARSLTAGSSGAQVRGHILFTLGLLLALVLAWHLRETLTLVYVSALFAVVLFPVVERIMDFERRSGKRISKSVAVVLLLGAVLLVIALFLALTLPPVFHDLDQFGADLPHRVPELLSRFKRLPMADRLGANQLAVRVDNALSEAGGYVFTSLPVWAGRVFDILTGFVLCVYFVLEGETAYQWFLSFFPSGQRHRLHNTLTRAKLHMSKWLFGQLLLMLILGASSTIVFAILHVRYFFLLGVLMGLFNIIPIVGGIITIALAAFVAALDSWTKMAGVLIFYAIYLNIENAYLTPRIMRSRLNLMGLTVLISLIAGTELAGIVGALVAVPTAALVAVFVEEYFLHKAPAQVAPHPLTEGKD